jgi:hypothetical protein
MSTAAVGGQMNQYERLLTLILQNSVLATFEYWSEFILKIQRDGHTRHAGLNEMFGSLRIPSIFCLRLRGTWRIGRQEEWDLAVQQFPLKGAPPVPFEAPMQASLLITKLGKEISAVTVSKNSDLILGLSDGSSIIVSGVGGGWDESWLLELPADDPDRGQWEIVCESQGIIGGRFPIPRIPKE